MVGRGGLQAELQDAQTTGRAHLWAAIRHLVLSFLPHFWALRWRADIQGRGRRQLHHVELHTGRRGTRFSCQKRKRWAVRVLCHAAATEERCCWYQAEGFNRDGDGLSPAWAAANPVTLHLQRPLNSVLPLDESWTQQKSAAWNTHNTNTTHEHSSFFFF